MLKRPRTTLVCALAMLAPGCGEAPRELPDWAESVLAPARTRAGAGREAEVDVPPQANGAVHLVDARTALGVFVALDGARPVAGTERDGMTFYPGAVDDADYVIVERPDGFEDFLLYHEAPAEPVARWRIELENVAGLRLIGSTLELLDEGGAPRLRARRPYLIDAHGRRLPASLELEGCRADRDPRGPWERPVTPPGADRCVIAVRWEEGVAYPAVLDPWIATGTMVTPRTNERGVVLGDGRVLVTCSNALEDTAEIYDPSTGTWALTGELLTPRHFCAPVRLVDGRVLVAGGSSPDYFSNFKPLGDGEIYDPATGLFTATPKMSQPRSNPQAVVLGDGRVLLLGGTASDGYGQGCGSEPVTTEIFDPSLGWFVAGPQPQLPHCAAAAAALPDGGALLAGDFSTTITERYDLQSNTWSPHGELTSNGSASTAVVLSDGRVMLLGGFPVYGEPSVLDAAIFDPNAPAASAWSLASPMLHWQPTAVALADRVFAIGDDSSGVGGGFLDIYDVASDTWHVGDPLDEPISSVTALDEHSVLVTGGHAGLDGHDKAWVFALLPDGASCDDAIECISLHCVDGVCCDTACGEPCHACSARLKGGGGDGVCDLVQADAPDPRGACQDDGGCGQTGRCSASGSCAVYEAGTPCTGAVCPAAQASCDGLGSCVCEAPRCSDDELTFDGRDCTPYRCNAQGCLTTCTGSEQCAPGFLCDRDAQCVLPAPEDAASCACRIASPASRSSSLLWLGLGGVLAFVRRRRSLTGVALVLGAALAACPSDVDPPPGSGGSTTAAIAGNGGGGAGGMEEGGHGGAGGAGGAAVGGHAGDGGRGGEGGAPMPTWTCLQTDYGTMNGCNCGCGIIDPDCADATVANCDYCGFDDYGTVYGTCAVGMCPGNVDPMNNATCLVPVCGNDIHDTGEECDDGNTAPKDGCDASCQLEPLPPGWTCGPLMGDPTCWCGCGAFDLRCADETAASCDFCPQQQGSCGDYMCVGIDPVDNKTCPTCGNGFIDMGEECDDANDAPGDGCANCHVTPPYHWTCSSAYYAAADGCDCGCGAFDPDCPDGNAASCDYCTDPGGCGTGLCPANIAPSDNATCAACGNGTLDTGEQCDDANTVPYDGCSPLCRVELYPPPAWSCVLSYYNAGDGCDCGCGVVDPDCADATVGSCAYCRPNGSCGNAACPANIDPIDNASCL